MNIIAAVRNELANNSANRITADLKATRQDLNLAQVVDFNSTIGQHVAELPDGSQRYFRHIGYSSVAIGATVSVTMPRLSVVGWSNSKPTP